MYAIGANRLGNSSGTAGSRDEACRTVEEAYGGLPAGDMAMLLARI